MQRSLIYVWFVYVLDGFFSEASRHSFVRMEEHDRVQEEILKLHRILKKFFITDLIITSQKMHRVHLNAKS